ncbi:MAG: hypothetical protein ACI4TY_01440 [Candidatus Limosilactobacillus intestinavium]
MTTGGTHLKTDSEIDAQKKERLAKIAVGAASVMMGDWFVCWTCCQC